MLRTALVLLLLAGPALAQTKPAPTPEREVMLRNNSQSVLRELYLWEAPATVPGPDRLGADVVRPGATYRLRLGAAGCRMELRAVFEDGGTELRSVDVCQTRELVLDDRNARPLEVVNNTDAELTQLYLSRPGAVGPDRLGALTVPGNDTLRILLRGETACEFEARAVFRGASEERRERVNICTAPSITFGDASVPLREVSLANRGRRVLREVYAVAGAGDWGPDRLGANVLNPGQIWLLRMRSAECRVRLRAVFADNSSEERADVDICAGQEITFGAARQVTLIHAHRRPVREVYLSAVTEADWGENLLGTQPLANGQRRQIGAEGGCQADLRIVFDNGNAEEIRNANICERREITLQPGWVAE